MRFVLEPVLYFRNNRVIEETINIERIRKNELTNEGQSLINELLIHIPVN